MFSLIYRFMDYFTFKTKEIILLRQKHWFFYSCVSLWNVLASPALEIMACHLQWPGNKVLWLFNIFTANHWHSEFNDIPWKYFIALQKYAYLIQNLTITIESSYMIMYMCQNFGVCDICRQIPKSICQVSYKRPSDFLYNFSNACFYLNRMKKESTP